MVSHSEVVENYFQAADRVHYNRGSRIFFEGDTLYSYGSHFILATKCKNGYLLNGDTYSVSTAKHQSITRSTAPQNSPIIPFSAIESMIDSRIKRTYPYLDVREQILGIEILDVTEDTYETVNRRDKNGDVYEAQVHHLGASLIKYGGKHYISSIDNGGKRNNFFMCELPGKPMTVKNAFRELANNLTDEQYKQYLSGEIQRQGEYFLIPERYWKIKKSSIKHKFDLSRGRGNAHIARDYYKFPGIVGTFIRGTLRHQQHKMISMGDTWHRVIKNTAKRSWSASGNVD